MQIKVDTQELSRLIKRVEAASDEVAVDAYEYFKQQTPKRSGNARSRTRLQANTIVADYPYAERLDQGWSKQNPNGMVEPTVEHIERVLMPQALRRAQNGQ